MSGILQARSSGDLPQDCCVAGDVDLAVEVLGIAREPRELRLQELTYGGLAPAYQARLEAMIAGTEKPNGAGRPGRRPRQEVNLLEGTKLVRDWRGVTHEVTVIEGGYEHQGRRYRSLSAIARAITGTQWSGPLFFGLRKTGSGG
jgi:hypothetical protein